MLNWVSRALDAREKFISVGCGGEGARGAGRWRWSGCSANDERKLRINILRENVLLYGIMAL